MHIVDYSVVIIYLALMVIIGITTRNSSNDISDYVRMGNKSTWWLAGFSLFMGTFSAATFTGIAGQAFIAGWSVAITPLCVALGFFIQAVFIAPMLRRTRAITPMDVVRSRFGPAAEQVKVYVSTLTSFFFAGFFLLGFATFASGLFGIPMWIVVVVMGVIVVFYSVTGGSWSVQITDSLQALILIPVTVAFAVLCLVKVGGFSGLFEAIEAAGLSKDFAPIKAPDHEYLSTLPIRKGNFTLLWVIASVMQGITMAISINSSHRYLSLKDEVSSRKAAALAGGLMVFGCLIWFIPPVVGRLFYTAEVEAVTTITNPADAAYGVIAMQMLPPGLVGMIFICMMAATMSSMDGFLTGTAGYVVRNLYQPLLRRLGRTEPEPKRLLFITKCVNLGLGIWAIFMAFVLDSIGGDTGMFQVMQTLLILIGAPISIPFALSLFIKRIPLWGLFAGIGSGLVASVSMFILRKYGYPLEWGYETFIMTAACLFPTVISPLFWKYTKPDFRALVDDFFELVNRPINVSEEVGTVVDKQLLKTVGSYVLIMSGVMLFLLFWCVTLTDVFTVLGISGFQFIVGGLMWLKGRQAAEIAQ